MSKPDGRIAIASGWRRWPEFLAADASYALRTLRKRPGFTAVVLLTLALGIGASTTIFTAVDAALLRPLPYGGVEDIAWIHTSWRDTPRGRVSPAEYLDYRDRLTDVFAAVGAYARGTVLVTVEGEAVRTEAVYASQGVLPALGVQPARGRTFTAEEDQAFAPVILISDAFWRSGFGAAPDAIGQLLTVDGQPSEIIGILPPGFRMPEEILVDRPAQIYLPHGIDPARVTARGSHYASGVARLREGVIWTRARKAIESLSAGFTTELPKEYPPDMGFRATIVPLADEVRGPVRQPLAVLSGAVVFVLLITCANVANLLLARADRRERELTLRAALGAGRARLMLQAIVESSVLAVAGGTFGIGFAALAIRSLGTWNPMGLPWLADLRLDPRVLAFAVGVTALTGLVFGAMPALHACRADLATALREGVRTAFGSRRSQRTRNALVATELAVSLVLLTGAGLMTRTFVGLLAVDPGFRTEQVVSASVGLPADAYPDDASRVAFFRELVPRLGALPGVTSAAAASNLPLASGLGDIGFQVEDHPVPEGTVKPNADWQIVTPGYFETMGLTLIRGRTVEERDTAEALGVAVVNRSFAELHWPDEDPIGKRFLMAAERIAPNVATVVGVVGDVRHEGLADRRQRPQMYFAHAQFRFWGSGRAADSMNLVVHSSLPTRELESAIRSAVQGLDADLPVGEIRTMAEVRRASMAVPRLLTVLLAVFSSVALVLAAVGTYGVVAYAVGRRLSEMGLRLALGARPSQVAGLVLAEGGRLVAVGLVLGLGVALAVTPRLGGLLYDVEPGDPLTLALVVAVLGLAALAACLAPALRASRVDPARLLRSE